MTAYKILGDILASCVIHAGIFTVALVVSSTRKEVPQEKIYRVTLAHIPMTAQTDTAHYAPLSELSPPQPEQEPVTETLQEKQETKPPLSPKEKTVSARKKKEPPKPSADETPTPRKAAQAQALSPDTAPTGSVAPFHIGGFDAYGEDAVEQPPSVAVQITPDYPQRARRMSVEGRVDVRLVVDETGKAQACAVYKAEPAGYFEEAALAAARRTRFIPGKLRGRPVNTLVHISFVFVLN